MEVAVVTDFEQALPLGASVPMFLRKERKWLRTTLYPDVTSIPADQTGQVISVGRLRAAMMANVDATLYATNEDATPPRLGFLLRFGDAAIAKDMLWPASLCSELFFGESETPLSTADTIRRAESLTPLVCLEFAPVNVQPDDLATLLHSIIALAQQLGVGDNHQRRGRARGNRATGSAFDVHVSGVKLQLHSLDITTDAATLLTTLAELGVEVLTLAVTLRASDISQGLCSRRAQGALFRAIASTRSSIEMLTFLGSCMDVAQVAGLATALATTRHLGTLELFSVFSEASSATRSAKWMWLAYALFSCESELTLDKLCINGHRMLASDVAAMVAVMRSPDPLRELLSRSALDATAGTEAAARVVHLAEDTMVRLAPLDEGDDDWEDDAFVLRRDSQLRILTSDSESEWASVLVPGFGESWVARNDASKITDRATRGGHPSRSHGVSALAFAFDLGIEDDFVALRRLLREVGGPLRSLELHQANGLTFACLRDVLRCCPRLENLYIEGVALSDSDMAAFIELYESRACMVSSLTLEAYTISHRALRQLANAVAATTTSAISKVLKELYVGEAATEVSLDAATVQAFVDMLTAHRTFLLLDLRLPTALKTRYQSELMRHDGQYVPVENAKLAWRSRLAFLSISTQLRFSMLHKVDSALLSLIFDFAAEAFTRRVIIASDGFI